MIIPQIQETRTVAAFTCHNPGSILIKQYEFNAIHCCIFKFPTNNEQSLICRENGVSESEYKN